MNLTYPTSPHCQNHFQTKTVRFAEGTGSSQGTGYFWDGSNVRLPGERFDRNISPLMDTQLNQYLPVLMLLFVAANFAVGTLAVSVLLGKSGRRTQTKDIPYECGMLPQGEGNSRLSIKFYLVALLFVLFDIEVVFMYPWAVTFKELARTDLALGLGGMLSFLGIVFVGYLYAVKKRAFDWKS